MKASKKLIFFGTEDFSLPSLKALVESNFNVVAVVTKPDSARGRSKQLVEPVVKTYAMSQSIPVYQPAKLADITDELIALGPDAGVLVSYGKLLPQRTLDLFSPIGIINLHPSLLPRYRGPAPIEAAIVHGDHETGISIMRLTLGMDEGPVFAQEVLPLRGNETKPELTKSLADRGAAFLVEQLPAILSGELLPTPQKNSDVSYTSLLTKKDSVLDPLTDDAYALQCKVRAYLGYPKTRLRIDNTDVIVTSAKVIESLQDDSLVVPCANGTYLEILKLTAPSGKTMSGVDFKRGYQNLS
jgi:methionyl-tRNA formyltransferase